MAGGLLASTVGVLSTGVVGQAIQQMVHQGPDLAGIAALMAGGAAIISAVSAAIVGWRSRDADKVEAEKEVLMDLLKEQLKKDEGK